MTTPEHKPQPGLEAAPTQAGDPGTLTDAELDGVAGGRETGSTSEMDQMSSLSLQTLMERKGQLEMMLSNSAKNASEPSASNVKK